MLPRVFIYRGEVLFRSHKTKTTVNVATASSNPPRIRTYFAAWLSLLASPAHGEMPALESAFAASAPVMSMRNVMTATRLPKRCNQETVLSVPLMIAWPSSYLVFLGNGKNLLHDSHKAACRVESRIPLIVRRHDQGRLIFPTSLAIVSLGRNRCEKTLALLIRRGTTRPPPRSSCLSAASTTSSGGCGFAGNLCRP